MDSARQAVRWTVPGLVFPLGVLGLHSLWHAIARQTSISDIAASIQTPAWIGIFATGIPIGFFIYQIYFRGYNPVGFPPRLGFYIRRDRGRFVLNHYRHTFNGDWGVVMNLIPSISEETLQNALSEVHQKQLIGVFDILTNHICSTRTPDLNCEIYTESADQRPVARRSVRACRCVPCAEEYRRRCDLNWMVFTALLDRAELSGNAGIKTEYTAGSDIYHGLGATRTAVSMAGLCSLIYQVYKLFTSAHILESPGCVVVAFIIEGAAFLFAHLYVMHNARRNATLPYLRRVAANLGSTFRQIQTPSAQSNP